MENMVMKAGPEKHLVLLLNKIDLVPREAAEKWLKYFREELPTVAFKCSTQEQKSNLGWKSGPKSRKTGKTGNASTILKTSDCLGAETLIKLLKNYSRSHEIKKSITVGVIGLPNVGKSSLINSLKRSHVANVGATPGLTRSMQEVQLDKHVKLLDCPGVVMLKSVENDASVALRNCKRIEKLDDPIVPVKEILKRCPERVLVTLYKVPSFDSVDDFLQKVATIRGRLKKGGVVDIDAAARIVLHDWNTGKIPYYTLPPIRNEGEPSDEKIVAVLGKEFNIDEVYGGESSFIGSLKSVNDFNPVEVPSNGPLNFDEKMLEDDVSLPDLNQSKDSGDQVGNGEDHSMESGDEEGGKEKTESTNSRQNKKLYTEEGMLNTKLRKAEKKRRKKENKSSAMEHDMDNDYDFKVDYARKESAMDVGDEDDKADDTNQNKFELPTGVELDKD
ncbi:guanine nucleotide-binding -like NSN1 [Olea europaea subsp. europaea]|nr:guanine nucleotide-binding -like NSN1 [Olea europaea subsp. europaea]